MSETEKKPEKKSGKKRGWLIVLFAAIVCVLIAIAVNRSPSGSSGSKEVTLEVYESDGSESASYQEKTDAEMLSGYMDQLTEEGSFSYEASKSTYGLYLEAVNGETADYQKDGAYWAIYVNGDYGQYSIDQQPIADGDVIQLRYEAAQ